MNARDGAMLLLELALSCAGGASTGSTTAASADRPASARQTADGAAGTGSERADGTPAGKSGGKLAFAGRGLAGSLTWEMGGAATVPPGAGSSAAARGVPGAGAEPQVKQVLLLDVPANYRWLECRACGAATVKAWRWVSHPEAKFCPYCGWPNGVGVVR